MSRKAKTKQELLESIRQSHQDLEKKFSGLTEEQMVWPGSMGSWSVKDILAHLTDWEQRFIQWYQAGLRGKIPETPAPGYTWRDLPRLNQSGYEKHRLEPLDFVCEQYKLSYQEIFALVQTFNHQEIFELGYYPWTGNSPLLSWIVANTSSHYAWARRNIRTTVICKNCP